MQIDIGTLHYDSFRMAWILPVVSAGIHVGNRPEQIAVVDGDTVSVFRFRRYIREDAQTELFYEKYGRNHPHVAALIIR